MYIHTRISQCIITRGAYPGGHPRQQRECGDYNRAGAGKRIQRPVPTPVERICVTYILFSLPLYWWIYYFLWGFIGEWYYFWGASGLMGALRLSW